MGTTNTPNLGLIKPDGAEPGKNYPAQLASNMDLLDKIGISFSRLAEATSGVKTNSAFDVYEVWGAETLTIPNPGRTVRVIALTLGQMRYNNATASRRLGQCRPGISFDNGSSWDYPTRDISIEVSGGNQRSALINNGHTRVGIPSGNIRVRSEAKNVNTGSGAAGDVEFMNGYMFALVMPV